jgi:hypothetical protein
MSGDARDNDAVWRDLVAHYSAPDDPAGSPAPWPDREDLPAPVKDAPVKDTPVKDTPVKDSGTEQGASERHEPGQGGPEPPQAGDDTDPGLVGQLPAGVDPVPGVLPGTPQIRIVRPAAPQPPPPAEEDEHYVPPPPPPFPKLDPVSKGAWVALFGGPAYLLVGVVVGWQIPPIAAFIAVAAFVGGFATLVVKMEDRPPTDSGSDDGAVV